MKQYPSIFNSSKAPRQNCYAWVKYDGSNLRAEFSRKRGWYKFGTRKLMFDETSPVFGPAIPFFLQKYGDELPKVFKHKDFRGVDSFIVFAEWFGAKSFAGLHEPDDPKDLVLFDVNPITKGMLGPKQFLDYFGHLPVAEHIYTGNLNEELIQNVKASNFEFLDFRSKYDIKTEVPEGIICKGTQKDKTGNYWMCKIKTEAYFQELRNRKPQGWEAIIQEDFSDS